MKIELKRLVEEAESILGISIVEAASGRLAYLAEETRSWYWVSREDLRAARYYRGDEDAYSLWCAASGREVLSCEVALGLSIGHCLCERDGRARCADRY